ncbi:core protein V [Simian adenovirus DM-2014]|uniref:Core-capsid bridging protein n=1 Tax=Simian adenovirus DM-2014 TaxID=1560346 RepID=A0A097IW72_9ADEN|nr:core protein V [Simian adenovirus DM-2014]AIT70979.1 core protein V [Simian adenovirus DM-2014]
MTKRKFKEELLQAIAPEIYAPLTEPDVKPDVKPRRLKRVKKQESAKKEEALDNEGVEFVRSFAPRRRVQWKGRTVRRILRPGTTVVFSPGERSSRTFKRSYDEVYADEDILEQALEQSGEFAYGKKPRRDIAVPLDESNPTPSLKPVTLQQILPVESAVARRKGIKREAVELQPTMQLMVPKRQKLENVLESMKVDPSVQPDVKIRPIKKVAPGLGVQTVDIQIPVENMEVETKPAVVTTTDAGIQTDPWEGAPVRAATAIRNRRRYGPASILMPNYALHPSIIPTPGYRGHVYQRRKTAGRRSRRRRRKPNIAPVKVKRVTTRRGRTLTLPSVRYHPTIL